MEHGVAGQPAMACPARRRHFGFLAFAAALLTPAIAPAASGSAPLPPPEIIRATPAMWIVRDADTTIYLFGTFHSLDQRTVWMENSVRAAFDGSDELVLETIVPTDPRTLRQSAATAGAARSDYLKSARSATAQSGMSTDHGADAVLRRMAEAGGKKVSGLEDFTEQLTRLANIRATPAPVAPAPAVATKPVTMAALFDAWRTGDGGAFDIMLAGLKSRAPTVYDSLIAQPNVRWASWIRERLDRPGTVFVAVGAGHLTGSDSVQHVLATRGIAATRIS